MALSFSEEFKASVGGKIMKVVKVTHDESTSNFTAASVDMTYFDSVIAATPTIPSDVANTSTLLQHMKISITAGGTTVEWAYPHNGSLRLILFGW